MHYFCTIAEQGQISRAARVLHMAQPPLSQRLRELEEELGSALFLRKGRSLQLTETGTLFYRRARDILRAVEAAREETIRAASQAGPTLRIGLSPTCRTLWLERFARLRALLPGHQFGLVVADSSYLETLLQNGQLDVALMQTPLRPEGLTVQRLSASRAIAVAPAGLLPASARTLSLDELSRHPLLLLRRSVGVGIYERMLHSFREAGLNPTVTLYSSDAAVLLELLRRGFSGIAVVPESEAQALPPDFRVLPIDLDLPEYQASLVARQGAQDADLLGFLHTAWLSLPDVPL